MENEMQEENNVQAQKAQVEMIIQITRKETGKVEEYHLHGVADMPSEETKEIK
jgi:hypothetical protein